MKGYDYQIAQIEETIEQISTKRKVLVQLPTGGGKTIEFALLAQRYIRNTGKAVLILVHRQELMFQAADKIRNICNIEPYLITKTTKRFAVARVYIGMVESTVRRTNMFDNVGLVIVDECHIATFNKIHNIFLEELIIGYTATPLSASKKEPLNKYYSSIIAGPQIKDLIKLGTLAQNITRCPKDIVDSTQFEIDKLKGDFNEKQMSDEYKRPKFVVNVVNNYFKYCFGQKTIIFNVSIEHSKEVNKCLQTCGYNSKHLDANSTDREEILEWFKNTPDAILNNVMIATVGFDEPTIQNVILNFSTLSLPKFIQTSGRASRGIPGKEYFNIIDMGGNCVRFGDWSDDRDWEYIFAHPDKPASGIAPVKTCPECEGLLHAATMVCNLINEHNEICGYEFQKKKTLVEQDLEEMIMITKGIDINAIIQRGRLKYDYFPMLEMGHEVVKGLYDKHKQPSETLVNRAFIEYYNMCVAWYNKYMAAKNGNVADITDSSFHIRLAKNNFEKLISKYKPVINHLQEFI